jgi:hypothetical protein
VSAPRRPVYVRLLGLRRLEPRPWLCFLLMEGSVLFGLLLALSELVPWQLAVAVPFLVAATMKIADGVVAARAGGRDQGTSTGVMRPSVAAVRAQQRAGRAGQSGELVRLAGERGAAGAGGTGAGAAGAGRATATSRAVAARLAQAASAPSMLVREHNRRVARGVAAVPTAARPRTRQARANGRAVGAWPMPVEPVPNIVIDKNRTAGPATAGPGLTGGAWTGPTVNLAPATGADAPGVADAAEAQPRRSGRGRNQGRFVARH